VPPALKDELATAYEALGEQFGQREVPVAVRSSALDEDSAGASFAGQHETFLNVVGGDSVAEAVAACWASALTERALAYRSSHGLPPPRGPIPVLVQPLVLADASGVVFSVDPVTGNRDRMVINVSWGLGESVVAGSVNPDTFHVRRGDLSVESREIANKQRMTVGVPGGTQEVEVPWALRKRPAIDDAQVAEVARVALALEGRFACPVDIECCWAGGELYILQCRAVTALPSKGGVAPNGS
jgi:pyruvate,water dikinase